MKTITVQISDRDYARLESGVSSRGNRVFDSPEGLASLAIEIGLYTLEAINFDVVGAMLGDLKIPRVAA